MKPFSSPPSSLCLDTLLGDLQKHIVQGEPTHYSKYTKDINEQNQQLLLYRTKVGKHTETKDQRTV